MIPVKLELQGLYSYKEKQTIDFEQLTAAGLFGIFGAVGSGKSSILEAIMLALYGNTERLAARGEKTSMVNLQSDLLFISFEFRAGKNNKESYKAIYISKRNKKNFDDVKPAEHLFYRHTSEGWTPIERRAEELVGMKMEHFRQTVIIPQGKFRDFIEQKPLARAEMMKELFGLERFDLSAKTGVLIKGNNEQKIRIQTQLHSLEDVSPEKQQQREALLKDVEVKTSEEGRLLEKLEATFDQWKSLQEKHLILLDLEERDRQLRAEKPAIEAKIADLQRFRKAEAYIRPVLAQLEEREIELEKYEVSHTECARWKIDYEEKVTRLLAEEEKLKLDQLRKGDREAKIRDLQKTITINALEAEVMLNQKAVDQLLPQSKQGKTRLLILRQQIADLEKKEESLEVPNTQLLADLKNIARELRQTQDDLKQLADEKATISQQQEDRLLKINQLQQTLPEDLPGFGPWIDRISQRLETLRGQREQLIQQQGLSAFAAKLREGESCPLCGATEHPVPLPHRFDENLLKENANQQQELSLQIDNLRQHQTSYDREMLQLEGVKETLNRIGEDIIKQELRQKVLSQTLRVQGISNQEDLTRKLNLFEEALDQQQQLSRQLKQFRKEREKHQEKHEQDEKKLRNAEQKLLALHTALNTQKGEIKFSELIKKYLSKPEEQIRSDIDKVQKVLDELDINTKRNQDKLKEARQGQATNLADLRHFQNLLEETRKKHTESQEELQRQLLQNGFSSLSELNQLLGSDPDPDRWEEDIKAYQSQVTTVRERLKELQTDPAIKEFKEEAFQELSVEVQSHKDQFGQLNIQYSLLQKEIDEIKNKLRQKSVLEKELSEVGKKEINLKELEKLFKGNGFVKYVSTIYLKELCRTANHRFIKLTKNSLSLETDEDNNFWVRDYLNGGKKRLLKSLSGGQTFQASLCLALALAEKVKSLNRADQSFFFLDEGFGALDRASLRMVFEALKSLRHENRVVGIISHVEELQQEIEVYAKVELDSETGSQVTYSF